MRLKVVLRYYLLFLVLLVFPLYMEGRQLLFHNLSGADGLSDLVINSLYKDSKGFLWIGTNTTLERFDGIRIKRYCLSDQNAELSTVNAIEETKNNQIWIGSNRGLWKVCGEKLVHVASKIIKSHVVSLLHDSHGILYIGTRDGLYIYKDNKFEHVLLNKDYLSLDNVIRKLCLGSNNQLWIITDSGLLSMTMSGRKVVRHYKSEYSFNTICRVDKYLYLGTTNQGLIRFDISSSQFTPFMSLGFAVISSLSSDGKDILYVGTDGLGVKFISIKKKQIVQSYTNDAETEGSLHSNSVYSVLADRDGVFWVGLYQSGLDCTYYQTGLFETYAYPPFFDSKGLPVRTLYVGDDGKLIGSRNGLFYVDEKRGKVKKLNYPFLRSDLILCCYSYHQNLYIGTYGGGMYVFNPISLTIQNFTTDNPDTFLRGHIFCINSDVQDRLWIGTSNGLFCYKNGKMLYHFDENNSHLPGNRVHVVFFDSTHKGWISTDQGMCLWDPFSSSLRTNIFPKNFINRKKVYVICEDHRHQLYFVPYKENIFVSNLSMTQYGHLSNASPLEGKEIVFIKEDKKGWLWIGTNNGLFHYDKKKTYVPYGFVDGIPSPIFFDCIPQIDSKGVVWFGNSKGLVFLAPGIEKRRNKSIYSVKITDIYASGKKVDESFIACKNGKTSIDLNTSQNDVTIFFSGLLYTNPIYVSYEYQMVGTDKDWKVITGKSEVTYYNLSSGKYHFRVRRMGLPETEADLYINMTTYWYIGKYTLFILMIIVISFYIFIRRKKLIAIGERHISINSKYKTINLSTSECEQLTSKLKNIMDCKKPYVNSELKINDLAAMMNVSAYTLSFLFNQYLKCNYYDFINEYRMIEFKQLVDRGDYSKYTLNALIESCGFSSRTTFFMNFKKRFGITPNEYIRRQKELKEND